MPTFYFMRHAESVANQQNILASQLNYPLSPKGMKEAANIAGKFCKQFNLDRIITSPLTRAIQTAEPFAHHFNINLTTDRNLLEQHLGRFSGMTYEEVKMDDDYQHDKKKRWDWIPNGGGESYQMIAQRLTNFFRKFENNLDDSHILVVSHAVTMRLIRALLENTIPQYPLTIADNGEIWITDFCGLDTPHVVHSVVL